MRTIPYISQIYPSSNLLANKQQSKTKQNKTKYHELHTQNANLT